ERRALEEQARASGCAGRIRFAGFLEPEKIDSIYALADIFVLPSHETWGVVVLEALAAGLQVLISNRVGCHADVRDRARVFEFGNVDALASALTDACGKRVQPGVDRNLPIDWTFEELAERLCNWTRERIRE
ncbi:MAG: glycosyltransferase, partial [Alphaproteobacteria bacterium]